MHKIKKYQWGQALSTLSNIQKGIKKDTEGFNSLIQGFTRDSYLKTSRPTPSMDADAISALISGFGSSKKTSGIGNSEVATSTDKEASVGSEIAGMAPELAETGLKALGGKEATIQGKGDQAFNALTSAAWKGALKTGNPWAIAGAGVLKGLDFLNRYAGKTAQKQGTDAGLKTGGYALQMSQGAGQKTTMSKNKWVKDINKQTKRADTQNLLAGRASYANTQNDLAATNTYGDIVSRTQQKLAGELGTGILSAKYGATINPKKLSNIKKKATRKIVKLQEGVNPDDLQKMQGGGTLNVIPEGALHARNNNYEGELGEQVTSKGIPVITYEEDGGIIQHAEIEHSEIIFNKEVSTKLEALYKKYKDTDDKLDKASLELECGKFITYEILENTEDNVGLLNQE